MSSQTHSEYSEPAIKSYFFGKGYHDLNATIADSWQGNLRDAGNFFQTAAGHWADEGVGYILAIIFFTASISVMVFGTALFLVLSAIHIIILFLFYLLILICFSLTYLIDKGFRSIKGFFTVCPECHTRSPLPEYMCPECHRWHRYLSPNPYGILYHTCLCGTKLPCVFFLGRASFQSRCANNACRTFLDLIHTNSVKAFVPVIGGPGVGKTVFLAASIEAYRQQAAQGSANVLFHEDHAESEFQMVMARLREGRLPDKTVSPLPRANTLKIAHEGSQAPQLLYLYDPAGEAFLNSDTLAVHNYLEYLSGILFLLEPPQAALTSTETASPDEVLTRLRNVMQERFQLNLREKLAVPVAVVVTKMDTVDDSCLFRDRVTAADTPGRAYPDELSRAVREKLCNWGLDYFAHQIETHCSNVRYFACSPLGREADDSGMPYASWGIVKPLEWIFLSSDKRFLPFSGG